MTDFHSSAWARSVFGAQADEVHARLAGVIRSCHERLRTAQEVSGARHSDIYGTFWIQVLNLVEDAFRDLPGVSFRRVSGARFKLPVVNNHALFVHRLSPLLVPDPRTLSFAPLSDQRSEALRGTPATPLTHRPAPLLWEETEDGTIRVPDAVAVEDQEDDGTRVLVAVSSSPAGPLEVWWGTASVDAGGDVHWHHLEPLPVDARDARGAVPDAASHPANATTGPDE